MLMPTISKSEHQAPELCTFTILLYNRIRQMKLLTQSQYNTLSVNCTIPSYIPIPVQCMFVPQQVPAIR